MINQNEAYFLGLIYSKGDILVNNDQIRFKLNIKFRRPNDEALRKDNIYTIRSVHADGKEKLGSKFSTDLFKIQQMLKNEFKINFELLLDDAIGSNWTKKTITILSDWVYCKDEKFLRLFNCDEIDSNTLKKFPFDLHIENNKSLSLSFIQGVCDASSLIPNEASSQNGGTGSPRIQLEPNQDRWELCIGLCNIFQNGLNIRVNNINWGHPQIRTRWKGQNHQFRVSLSDIPKEIELYRLDYKRDEYHNLYKRTNTKYDPTKELCPQKKKGIHNGLNIYLSSSNSEALNNEILHKNLRGISINESCKKSIIVCYLLGCPYIRKLINVFLDGKKI